MDPKLFEVIGSFCLGGCVFQRKEPGAGLRLPRLLGLGGRGAGGWPVRALECKVEVALPAQAIRPYRALTLPLFGSQYGIIPSSPSWLPLGLVSNP